MSTTAILVITIPTLVVLAGVVLLASLRRRADGEAIGVLSRETRSRDAGRSATGGATEGKASATAKELELATAITRRGGGAVVKAGSVTPVAWVPPDPDKLGETRRQFLNRSVTGMFVLGLSGFGASIIAFLWPKLGGGFGSEIRIGKIADIETNIDAGAGFYYYPDGRMWITRYPASALEKARGVYSDPELAGMEAGLIALYQKCVHLGCRVPQCVTSQWFECPCHGSQYNQVGEKKGGPAPRGLDRFTMSVDGDTFVVNTAKVIQGPPIGTNTTGQEAEGPHCISGGSH
jgi:cytochrome b6-f complex iron-sulfur subunit